jgi:hypothetical protein
MFWYILLVLLHNPYGRVIECTYCFKKTKHVFTGNQDEHELLEIETITMTDIVVQRQQMHLFERENWEVVFDAKLIVESLQVQGPLSEPGFSTEHLVILGVQVPVVSPSLEGLIETGNLVEELFAEVDLLETGPETVGEGLLDLLGLGEEDVLVVDQFLEERDHFPLGLCSVDVEVLHIEYRLGALRKVRPEVLNEPLFRTFLCLLGE